MEDPSVVSAEYWLSWMPIVLRVATARNPGAGPEGAEPGLHARRGGGGLPRALHKLSKITPRSPLAGDRVNRTAPASAWGCCGVGRGEPRAYARRIPKCRAARQVKYHSDNNLTVRLHTIAGQCRRRLRAAVARKPSSCRPYHRAPSARPRSVPPRIPVGRRIRRRRAAAGCSQFARDQFCTDSFEPIALICSVNVKALALELAP
jgi:hypothetical protein